MNGPGESVTVDPYDLKFRLTRIRNGLCPECGTVLVNRGCPRLCESPEMPPLPSHPATPEDIAWALDQLRQQYEAAMACALAALDREPEPDTSEG